MTKVYFTSLSQIENCSSGLVMQFQHVQFVGMVVEFLTMVIVFMSLTKNEIERNVCYLK